MFIFQILLLVIASIFSINIFAVDDPSVPYCMSNQLSIYEVALDSPGMMKTNTLYGIINTSGKACYLNGTPALWGLAQGQNIYAAKTAKMNGQNVLLKPLTNSDSIRFNELVWFSLSGNAAENGQQFSKIKVILPGISDQAFTLPYDGYSTGIDAPTTLQQGMQNWSPMQSDSCVNSSSVSNSNWPETIYFKKRMTCG